MVKEKTTWYRLPAGKRFKEHYRINRNHGPFRRASKIVAGCFFIMAGIPMVPLPGPGWAVIIIGTGLISGESYSLSRGLDWADKTALTPAGLWIKRHPFLTTLISFILISATGTMAWFSFPQYHSLITGLVNSVIAFLPFGA